MKRRVVGFTLIELLVSIFILSTLSLLTYQALRQVVSLDQITAKHADNLSQLQHVIGVMERDFLQLAPRPIVDELQRQVAAVNLATTPWPRIEFTRAGIANPLDNAKSSLMRVAWEFSNGQLSRTTWSVLDRSAQTQPYAQETLLTGVSAMKIRALFDDQWRAVWPPSQSSVVSADETDSLVMTPRGIEVIISRDDHPDVKRLFVGVGG